MSVEIPLSQGLVAIVDADMKARVLGMRPWHAIVRPHTTYAKKSVRRADMRWTTLYLHTFITGWPFVDHINGDGLDNRRANLRPADNRRNQQNSRRPAANTSGFKGVFWEAGRCNRWRAQIRVDGRKVHLGLFDDPTEAAKAYDSAAANHYGEFARLNFPEAPL
jgi:AP2 domain